MHTLNRPLCVSPAGFARTIKAKSGMQVFVSAVTKEIVRSHQYFFGLDGDELFDQGQLMHLKDEGKG